MLEDSSLAARPSEGQATFLERKPSSSGMDFVLRVSYVSSWSGIGRIEHVSDACGCNDHGGNYCTGDDTSDDDGCVRRHGG